MSHPYPGLVAGGDINPCRFVKGGSSAMTVLQAGAGDAAIGFSREFVQDAPTDGASTLAASSGKVIQVIRQGQLGELDTAEAILAWAYLKPDANGKAVNALAGEYFSARAYDAQATSGNRVLAEAACGFVPILVGVQAKTANYTVVALTDNGASFSTDGAAGTVTFAMPAATVGQKYRFRVGAAQELRIDPNGTETIALPSTGVQGAAGKYLTANADGETVLIECVKTGQWSVFGYTGTWTAEP
jgi:hypothetical protein